MNYYRGYGNWNLFQTDLTIADTYQKYKSSEPQLADLDAGQSTLISHSTPTSDVRSFWSFMICVSVDETDDGLNSKTEEVSGGDQREHWTGKSSAAVWKRR